MNLKTAERLRYYRKKYNYSQEELAEKIGVSRQAVSKWERDLSCPDINSLPALAEILEVTVDELMQVKTTAETPKKSVAEIIDTVLKAIVLAKGLAVTVQSALNELEVKTGMTMLGIGLACVGITLLNHQK